MQAAGELVLEPVESRMSDGRFALVFGAVALGVVAIVATFLLLPRGFGVALALAFAYPFAKTLLDAYNAHQMQGPRLVIGAAFLEAGGLRFAWRDVSDVSVGPSSRVRDRRDRVKVRLNRLVPVRPTYSALRAAGLELGDQYFDFAIPPIYRVGPSEIAAQIEARRGAVRRAAPRDEPAPAAPPEPASAAPARRRRASRPTAEARARRRPPSPGPR